MRLVIHGGGYTGFTGAMFAARAGHDVVLYEPDEARVAAINEGREPVVGIADWLGADLFNSPSVVGPRATSNFDDIAMESVHIFAVPTERDGEPMFSILNMAIERVVKSRAPGMPLVLSIESTVCPDFTATLRKSLEVITKDRVALGVRDEPYVLIVAPRRDWFVGKGHTVETCERVIGVDSPHDRTIAERIYGPISKTIHWTDTETAEIVKQLENAMMYAGVTFLMGFALTYPQKNVREIIRLAETHWRLPQWYLTLGVAGYCVPLGMKYLTRGTGFEYGQMALATEEAYRDAVAGMILSNPMLKRIVILGVSDKPNQRIQHLSPALTLFHSLLDAGRTVLLHDKQFTAAELGIPAECWVSDENDLGAVDAVVVHTAYPEYRSWLPEIHRAALVIDGPGLFEVDRLLFARMGARYFRPGDAGWLALGRESMAI